jgi:hypothetical protein
MEGQPTPKALLYLGVGVGLIIGIVSAIALIVSSVLLWFAVARIDIIYGVLSGLPEPYGFGVGMALFAVCLLVLHGIVIRALVVTSIGIVRRFGTTPTKTGMFLIGVCLACLPRRVWEREAAGLR